MLLTCTSIIEVLNDPHVLECPLSNHTNRQPSEAENQQNTPHKV